MSRSAEPGDAPVPPANPMTAAQKGMRPDLPRRFYSRAEVFPHPQGWAVRLDGRPVRTPGRAEMVVPAAPIAEALAAEWQTQGERIDPGAMPLTRTVNSAIDGVRGREAEVVRDLLAYAGSDLLCYRAEHPRELVERQSASWNPLLNVTEASLGCRFRRATGIIHVPQPAEALAAVERRLAGLDSFVLAGLHVVTTLTGSVLLALAIRAGWLTPAEAWAAAHVDEDWQISLWGEDSEARRRREHRWTEMQAACLLLQPREAPGPQRSGGAGR